MIFNKDILRFTVPLLHYCNLDCSYCHVPNERMEYLDFEIFKKAVDFFYEAPGYRKNLVLYWWEPLLLSDDKLTEIIDYALLKKDSYPDKLFILTIVTNLTVFRDSLIPILERVDNLCISIDWREETHNINRWQFNNTFDNFQKISKSKKIMSWANINKVVNIKNVYTFLDDVKYLLDTFKLPVSYSSALSVWDWDKKSTNELSNQLTLIYDYAFGNGIEDQFDNFFQIPMKCCPFGTLSMWLNWDIYNCEFIANDYINNTAPIISLSKNKLLKTSIENCFFNFLSEDCIKENCLSCWSTCTNFSFQDNKSLKLDQIASLGEVKWARQNHMKFLKEIVLNKHKSTHYLNVKWFEYDNMFKLYNYIISLWDLLWFKDFYLYVDISDSKLLIINKILSVMLKKWWNSYNVYINNKKANRDLNILLDLHTGFLYNKNKYVWTIFSEINSFI